MADDKFEIVACFPRDGADWNNNAPAYWEKIKPALMTAEEYFAEVEPREEWQRRHEEKALSEFYGAEIKVSL